MDYEITNPELKSYIKEMGEVGRTVDNIVIQMRKEPNHPSTPHIHAIKAEREASFKIDGSLLANSRSNGLSNKELEAVRDWIISRRRALDENWEILKAGGIVKKIP